MGSAAGRAFIIGSMKAGTTTLFRDLSAHPTIGACSVKEPSFFSESRTAQEREEYERLFPSGPSLAWLLEASTDYAKDPMVAGVPERLSESFPEARCILLARDPLRRIVSHHRHNLLKGRLRGPLVIDDTLRHYISVSDYERQVRRYESCFRPEQLMIVPLEGFAADRQGWGRRIHAFLGVEPFVAPNLQRVANQASERARPRALGRRLGGGRVRLILERPGGRLIRPLLQEPTPSVVLSPPVRAHVVQELGASMADFAARVGPDFAPWVQDWA